MTKEEAIAWLEHHFDPLPDGTKQSEAVSLAIKALEQESCGDAISRQAVLEMAYDMSEIDGEHFTAPCMVVDVEDIQKLPSVNPQEPKTDTLDKIRAKIEQTTSRYTISREPAWCEHLMWDRARNSMYPILLEYKYYENPENDIEAKRRINYLNADKESEVQE